MGYWPLIHFKGPSSFWARIIPADLIACHWRINSEFVFFCIFFSEKDLWRMEQTDQGKIFRCNFCGRCFGHVSSIKRHSLIHTGERPYMCDVCGKDYRRKHHLEDHFKGVHLKKKSEWVSSKIVNFFLLISLNICFGCSKEPSHRDSSFEYPQHIFWLRFFFVEVVSTLYWG